jgi:PPP family 3-phenylpropionic acid transporter
VSGGPEDSLEAVGTVAQDDERESRDLVRLKVLFTASGAGIGTLMPYLAVYLAWRGLSATLVGLVLGLMAAVGVVTVPLWGAVADRGMGAAAALRLSCVVAALGSLTLLAAGSWLPGVVLAAAVLAAARAPGEALADTVALTVLGSAGGRRYGAIRLWSSVGFAVAVAGWGVVLERTSLALVLLAYPAALLLVLAAARLPVTAVPGTAASPAGTLRSVVSSDVALLLTGVAVFGIAMGASWTVLPLRLTDLGGGVGAVAAAAVVGALAEIPFMRSSGVLRQRLGSGRVFLVGGVLFSLSTACYGVLTDPRLLVAASVLRGAGYALVYVGLVTAMASLLPAHQQATGQALLQTTLMGVAPVVGASLGGFTYEHAPVLLFGAVSILALVGAMVARAATGKPSAGMADRRTMSRRWTRGDA